MAEEVSNDNIIKVSLCVCDRFQVKARECLSVDSLQNRPLQNKYCCMFSAGVDKYFPEDGINDGYSEGPFKVCPWFEVDKHRR